MVLNQQDVLQKENKREKKKKKISASSRTL